MEPHQSLTALSKSALGAALVRGEESLRPDRLFDDPYAEVFLAAAPEAFADDDGASGDPAWLDAVFKIFSFHAVIRTRFFDDYLVAACASGCGQVVLLAAGLDTRAFRLPLSPGARVFELDLPAVFTFKEQVLAEQRAVPRCERAVVPVDLREDWAARLVDTGFRPTELTAWLAEGLLIYLSADEAAGLLSAVGELSRPDSRLSFDHGTIADTWLLSHTAGMPGMERFTSLWKGGLGDDAPDWLTRRGWHVQMHDRSTVANSYGRAVPDHSDSCFITAVRADRRQPSAGDG